MNMSSYLLQKKSTTIEICFVLFFFSFSVTKLCTLSKIRSGSFGGPLGGPVGFGEVRRLRGVILEGEEIEGGHFGEVRRLRGVILAK